MILENKHMERYFSEGKGCYGHITLNNLAIPSSVKVTVLGKEVIPESFDSYGHPNFTDEQETMFSFEEDNLKRQNGGEYTPVKAEISYKKRTFNEKRRSFNSLKGIEKSLKSLADLNKMLENRRMFRKAYPNKRLFEYMIFGCFWLDQFGQVWSVEKKYKGKLKTKGNVEYFKTFSKRNLSEDYVLTSGGYCIPAADSICPCCGKKLTLEDINNNPCVYVNGKYYHDKCWRNYRRITEINKFTNNMMDFLYKETDYSYELLPNGYCDRDCCSHIPWFLFHTIDGDIIMGWRKRVISIEWQENYKPFDMEKLFGKEDVTKWENNGKRGIHAWGKDKAYEYLSKVLKTVNPEYSKW